MDKRKRIYATLWVDDYGSLRLRRKDIDWYHRNAGPISFALECDEHFPWSFDVLSMPGYEDFSLDYLSHHYHPLRWKGLSFPKRIYDRVKLHKIVWSCLRLLRIPIPPAFFRIGWVAALIIILGLICYLFLVNILVFIILIVLFFTGIGLLGVWYYVRSPNNWEYPISDMEFNRQSILKAKEEFEKRGIKFPKVIRHGWNLPWKGSMEFYMKIGVIADASAVSTGVESHPMIGEREVEWTLSQPYFASLSQDYNIPWYGKDEQDRGLLELPVNLGNISTYGFGEREKKIIEEIPDEGLVSCYIHPQDSFRAIREWVQYLKANYDVRFVTAEETARIYAGIFER